MADIADAGRRATAGRALELSPPGRWRPRAAIGLALAWAALVAAVYYRRLWLLLAAGPSTWSLPEVGQSLRWTGVPWLRDAIARAAFGIGAAAVVVAAVWTCGRLATRWLVPPDATRGERRVIEFATGVGVFAYALFALAAAGWFVRPVVAGLTLTLACIAVLFLAAESFGIGRGPIPKADGTAGAARRHQWLALARSPWWWLTVAACAVAFFCALAPETEYDALWYHLELPRRWLDAARPVDDVNEYVSLYPLTWELLFGAALALDGDVGARLVHWATLPLCAVIAGWLAQCINGSASARASHGPGRTPPALAAAVAVTAPTVLWEATTAYVDLALALHAALAAYALVRASTGSSSRWLAVAAVQLGLCCATKHLGLLVVAAALVTWVGATVYRDRSWRRALERAVLIGTVAILLPAPWYIRAALASGNPVFPELYGVFGAWPPERWNATVEHALAAFKAGFGRSRTLAHQAALPWDMSMHPVRYFGTFGPTLLAFLPFTIAAAARSHVARALGAGALLYFVLWASPVSSFQLRFLVPFWIVAAPLLAAGIQMAIDAAGSVRAPLRGVVTGAVAVLLALDLPPSIPLHEGDRVGWSGWLTHVIRDVPVAVVAGGVSREAYLDEHVRSAAAWRWINANTPADTRVLTFLGGDQFLADRARLWSETPAARAVTWDAPADVDRVIRRVHGLGIRYVLVQKPLLRTPAFERLVLLRPDVLARHFDVAHEDFWMLVYRVRRETE
jgi:4-amino-4-deoxy-L-arabinose transferase-like glycosyltransferase